MSFIIDEDFLNLSVGGLLITAILFEVGRGWSTIEGVYFTALVNRDMRETFICSNGYLNFNGDSFTALSLIENY